MIGQAASLPHLPQFLFQIAPSVPILPRPKRITLPTIAILSRPSSPSRSPPMLRLRGLALAVCALALGALFVHAQEIDAQAVVRKAIAAHGGEKDLGKFQAGMSKYKGTMHILNQ